MVGALREFAGLPHRCEIVGDFRGVRWINDSKGTNVGATVAALEGMGRPVVLIAGGQAKNADFGPWRDPPGALRGKSSCLVRIVSKFGKYLSRSVPVTTVTTLDEATRLAANGHSRAMWFFFLPHAQVSICSTISNTEATHFEILVSGINQ